MTRQIERSGGRDPSAADWCRLVIATSSRCVLAVTAGLLLFAYVPAVFGWQPTTVMSDSMRPHIHTGDVVVTRPVDGRDAVPGQVLLVVDPDHPGATERLRLHRMVRVDARGDLVLRGDANRTEDSTPVAPSAVRGLGVLRAPWVGTPVVWAHEGRWLPLGGLVVAGLALAAATRLDRPLLASPPVAPDHHRPGPPGRDTGTATPRRSGSMQASGAVPLLAAVVLLSLLVEGRSGAAAADFTAVTSNAADSWRSAAAYTCLPTSGPDSPYALYRLDQVSGPGVPDTSGAGRHSTLQNNGTWGPGSCVPGDSPYLTLDGSAGTYFSTPTAIPAPSVFTLEIWVRTTTTTGGRLIGFSSASTGLSTTYDRMLYLSNAGTVVFGVYPGSTPQTVTSSTRVNDGQWHHVVGTLSAAGLRVYVDGNLEGSDAAVTSAQPNTGYWRVGFDKLGGTWPQQPTTLRLVGSIDHVAVYSTALDATAVHDHHAAGR